MPDNIENPPQVSENDEGNGEAGNGGPVSLEQRLATIESEKAELKDRLLRLAAEFENWKKRSRKEQADNEAKARESVLKDMLEISDNLERATGSWGEQVDLKQVQQGVALVLRLFQGKLERYDVKVIDTKGQPFDPRIHDAISKVPSADVAPGTVVSELQRGYRIGERLLRPATVVVAMAPTNESTEGSNGASGSGSENA